MPEVEENKTVDIDTSGPEEDVRISKMNQQKQ